LLQESPLYTFTALDTRALLNIPLQDPYNSNAAVNLTGITVTLYGEPKRGGPVIGPISCPAQGSPTLGIVQADFKLFCAAGADLYTCQLNLNDGSANPDQRSDDFTIHVKRRIA
jgi:hypothetical protein